MYYHIKYKKYKNKFLTLKNQIGGLTKHLLYICNDPINNADYKFVIDQCKIDFKSDFKSDFKIERISIEEITYNLSEYIKDKQHKFDLIYISNCNIKKWQELKTYFHEFMDIINKILSMLKPNIGVLYIEDTSIIHEQTIIDLTSKGHKIILNRSPPKQPHVLVLCQRKIGSYTEPVHPIIISNLDNYIKGIYPDANIKYLTNGYSGNFHGNADYKMTLKTDNKDAQLFTKQYNKFFDLIILNTCPFIHMDYNIIHKLLKDNGRMIFTASAQFGFRVVKKTEYRFDLINDCPDLYLYFKKFDETNDELSFIKK